MTTRDDVTVYYHLDPRLIIVQAPSTEMTMQDLHDTLSDIDDEPANMVYPHLVQSAGKDDLGGGVTVGITLTLRNAQICFARRENIVGSGTCTSSSSLGFTLQQVINSGATFVTDNIARGMWASNTTKGFPCEIVSVDSQTQLSVLDSTLGNWEAGDTYVIWETQVCNLTGGNLVATDYDGNSIIPVFPTYATSLTKTSSSSATLSAQQQLEYGTFDGGVHVRLTSSYSGTTYPVGTPQQPVNNFADALTIAQLRGFSRLYVYGSCTIDSGLNFSSFEIIGESPNKTTFTISAAADVTDCEFSNATVQGTLDGGNVLTDCSLLTLTYVEGIIQRCLLLETITLSGAATAFLLDCWSGVPGAQTPTINMGGSGSSLAVRNYAGGIKITNRTGTDPISIDLNSGQVIIDDTVTNGTITLRGVGQWGNEKTYAGGATIDTQLITFQDTQQLAFEQQNVLIDSMTGYSGTAYPRGTSRMPVNNLSDALIIASNHNLRGIKLHGAIVISSGTNIEHKHFIGLGPSNSNITVNPGVLASGASFHTCTLQGTLGVQNEIEKCLIYNIDNFNGIMKECMFAGTINCGNFDSNFLECYQAPEILGNAIINPWNSTGTNISDYQGHIRIGNKTGSSDMSISMVGGLVIYNTNVSGEIDVHGVGRWYNAKSYSGGTSVTNDLVDKSYITDDILDESLTSHMIVNTAGWALGQIGSGIIDTNIVQVSGAYVSLKDLQGEAGGLTTTSIANAVWNQVMDAGYSAEETMKIMVAALAGKLAGAAGTTITIRDINDTKTRITATVDSDGNRLSVTLDGN